MAVNFVARKCACGGKLEFDATNKIWICMYCGTVVEREATFNRVQVDGIEGINDVVRQTLMDIAYKRIESAERNLADCERKNHMHVGTLIADLSLCMTKISFAKGMEEARNLMDKVKFLAKRLKDEFPVIAEDEINLYESFGNNASDIYASLLIVFDTLKDESRLDYISSIMNVGEVFSKDANKSLLKMSIKKGKLDVVDSILRNINNIHKKSTLFEIMDYYPDSDKKRETLKNLLDKSAVDGVQNKVFEDYFISSGDSVETKNLVLNKIVDLGIKCNPQDVLNGVYQGFDGYDNARVTFNALCKSKLTDHEIDMLIGFALIINKRYEFTLAYFDSLIESECFVKLNSKVIIMFLDNTEFDVNVTEEILDRMFKLEIDNKSLDAIISYYLCNNRDSVERRKTIIEKLLYEKVPVSTSTVENYVLSAVQDGKNKPDVLKMIFDTGFNKIYINDILSKYIVSAADDKEAKDYVIDYLISLGFKVDSKVLNQYISASTDEPGIKEERIRKLVQNGTQARSDSLDTYLISLKNVNEYSPEIFKLLSEQNYSASETALEVYIFKCKDVCKAENAIKLIDAAKFDLSRPGMMVTHLGNKVECNIFQAYLLTSEDGYDVTYAITEAFNGRKVKLTSEVKVNGNLLKFKKYLDNNRADLSEISNKLCEKYKVFSLF